MLNIGRACGSFRVDQATVLLDDMSAPYSTWSEYATVYGEVENSETRADESMASGPRRELTKSMTLIVRCHPSQTFSPAMRLVDLTTGDTYAISAVRYDTRRTTAYIDCIGGSSAGGVP
jgi:hypothetical protein